MKKNLSIIIIVVFFSSCYYDKEDLLYNSTKCDTTNARYNVEVANILSANCLRCHGGNAALGGGIKLGTYDDVKIQALNGRLLGTITHTSGFSFMPKDGGSLSACNIALIGKWIKNGALNN